MNSVNWSLTENESLFAADSMNQYAVFLKMDGEEEDESKQSLCLVGWWGKLDETFQKQKTYLFQRLCKSKQTVECKQSFDWVAWSCSQSRIASRIGQAWSKGYTSSHAVTFGGATRLYIHLVQSIRIAAHSEDTDPGGAETVLFG